ncbi:hypothetical protein [Candidatus Aquiluna sp. UB-MaderosW2red]|nr:hypothetical protein [Candidatus Aquiluna sp. UB-MaderosW2red]
MSESKKYIPPAGATRPLQTLRMARNSIRDSMWGMRMTTENNDSDY